MFNLAPKVANAGTRDLRELAEVAGCDARTFYVDADLSGVDVRGQDLRGMDLSFARLEGILADEHTKVDGRFRTQLLEQALITARHSFKLNLGAKNAVAAGRAGLEAVALLLQLERHKEASSLIGRMAAAPNSAIRLPTQSQTVLLSAQLGASVHAYTTKWIQTRDPKRQDVLAMAQFAGHHLRRYQDDILTWVARRRSAIGPLAIVFLLEARSGSWSEDLMRAWNWGGQSREAFRYAHLVDLQLLLMLGDEKWEMRLINEMQQELAAPSRGGGEAAQLAFELVKHRARRYSAIGIEALLRRTQATLITFPNEVEALFLYGIFSFWRQSIGSRLSHSEATSSERLVTTAAAILIEHETMAAKLRLKLNAPRNWRKFNSTHELRDG